MRKLTVFNLFIAVALILGSCATSNDVVSNRLISKRKYTKGFFIKKNGATKSKGDVKEIELAESNDANSNDVNYRSVSTPSHTADAKVNPVELSSADVVSNADVASIDDDMSTVVNSNSTRSYENEVTETSVAADIEVTKEQKKELKKELKKERKENNSSSSDDAYFILIVIITILIPPLGVGLYTNVDWTKVLISLLLTFLFYIPGLVYSLLVVFDVI